MGKINVGRLILSGIIIGVITDIVEGIMNGWLLADRWTAALAKINHAPFSVSDVVIFNIWGLIAGLTAAWIYVGFRSRFGAGHMTAIYAALTVWVLGYFLPYLGMAVLGLPGGLMVTVGAVGLVEIVFATIVGAYFYQEDA